MLKKVNVYYFNSLGELYATDVKYLPEGLSLEDIYNQIEPEYTGLTYLIDDGGDGISPFVKKRLYISEAQHKVNNIFD